MTRFTKPIIVILILALALTACAPQGQINSTATIAEEIDQKMGTIETIITIVIIYWLLKIGIETYDAMQQQQ